MRCKPSEFNISEFMAAGLDRGLDDVTFLLDDGEEITLPPQLAVLNLLFWDPLMHMCVPILLSDVQRIDEYHVKIAPKLHTHIYKRLLKAGVPRDQAIREIWLNTNKLNSFVEKYLARYCGSISALSLARMMKQQEVRKICDIAIKQEEGTKVAEAKIRARSDEFNKLIETRGALKDNVLLNYAASKVLKPNQIKQMFLMYGCRSDIDITMQPHIITRSAFNGLRSVDDFATEALSAKMSSYFNSVVIRDTQDFARLLKLACLKIGKIYPGDCGAHRTMKYLLNKEYRTQYLNCNIVVNGERIELTDANIDLYLGKEVDLVSPMLCNHTDGTCEWCAGRADADVLNWLPPNIHIGLYAAALLAAWISQRVLSNKHLIDTDSKEYNFVGIAKDYFIKDGNGLLFAKSVFDYRKKAVIKIPLESIGPVSDLYQEEPPTPESFSQISVFEVQLTEDGDGIELEMSNDGFTPFLSEEFIAFMSAHKKSLTTDEENLIVPLRGWNFAAPVFKYVVLNYNMIRFSKAVSGFFTSDIKNYTSIRRALENLSNLIYQKGEINFFYLQILMKCFMITDALNYATPLVTDPDNVKFDTMHAVSSHHAITTKLSQQKVHELISSPEPCIVDKPSGYFDIFYGL